MVTATRYIHVVLESARDLEELQALIDRSRVGAGQHLRAIFAEEDQPTARELSEELTGIFEMHLGTVTSTGAPLVAPIDGVFYKGRGCCDETGGSVPPTRPGASL